MPRLIYVAFYNAQYVVGMQATYSNIMSDDDVGDEVLDDVTDRKSTRSPDVISGTRDTVDGEYLEGDSKTPKMSAEFAAEDFSEGSADQSSRSADQVSEITDRDDDGDDESDFLTTLTISESLEEKDREALELERSTGLTASTGETLEYIESDENSGSVNEDLEKTLPLEKDDAGSSIHQPVHSDDEHPTDRSKTTEDVLQNSTVEVAISHEQSQDDENSGSCSANSNGKLESKSHDMSTNESSVAEDLFYPEHDILELTTNDQRHSETCKTDVGVALHLEQPEFRRDNATDDSETAEDSVPPHNDSITSDQQLRGNISMAQISAALESEQSEVEQNNVDSGADPLGQTVTLEEDPEGGIESSCGQTAENIGEVEDRKRTSYFESRENVDSGSILDSGPGEYAIDNVNVIEDITPSQNDNLSLTTEVQQQHEERSTTEFCRAEQSPREQDNVNDDDEDDDDDDDDEDLLAQTMTPVEGLDNGVSSPSDQRTKNLDALENRQEITISESLENPDLGAMSCLAPQTDKQDRYTDDSKALEGILSHPQNVLTTEDPKQHHEENCAAQLCGVPELEQPELKDDNVDNDDLLGQTAALEEASEADVSSSSDQTTENFDATEDRQETCVSAQHEDADLGMELDLSQQKYATEDILPPETDERQLTIRVQQHQEVLELENSEPKRDSIDDDDDPLGRTVTLEDNSEADVSSPGDQTTENIDTVEDCKELTHDVSGSRENPDEKDAIDLLEETCSGNNFEIGPVQDEAGDLQQDPDDVSPTGQQPSVTETNQDRNDSGGVLEHAVTLEEMAGDGDPLSSDETPENLSSLDRQENTSCIGEFEENRKENSGKSSPSNMDRLASNPELNPATAIASDRQEEISSKKEVKNDSAQENEQNFQRDVERSSSNSDLSIAAERNYDKEIPFEEDRPSYLNLPNPERVSDLSIATLSPNCLQLELLSKSPSKPAVQQKLEVSRRSPGAPEDEEKNNLLCLLDNRRRAEMDKNEWQLARRTEDQIALVRDAELDDLENVQVSVKVSRIC